MRAIVISLDVELATGFHDRDSPPRARVDAARDACLRLVDRFEAYDVPATWAVVGHLFLESCDGVHADHPAVEGWFEPDPGGDEATAPNWYAPSVLDAVEESPVDHEIGSHTFSHVEFGKPTTTESIARAELERCVELAEERGIELDSLVFPRNNVGHRGVLADCGFTAYRGVAPRPWYHETPLRPVAKGLSYVLGRTPPPVVAPTVDEHGLVNVPASLNLFAFEGAARSVTETVAGDPVVRKVRQGLDALTERDDGLLHLWLHPNNITSDAAWRRMERVLELVDRCRSETGIPVRTMRAVATEHRPDRSDSTAAVSAEQ